MEDTRSKELFEKAKKIIPGGVNSPVRAFGSVGLTPRFIKSAKGDRITDVDENEYIEKEEIYEKIFSNIEVGTDGKTVQLNFED